MKVEIVMPKMGESLQEGTIINWLKQVGEEVERDEMILEISTDKVDTEVPSPVTGTIVEILAQENDTVEVGTVIAYVETEAGATAPVENIQEEKTNVVEEVQVSEPALAESGNVTEVVMPKMGESLQEGTIVSWLKAVGDEVERDEMILEISTDKVDTEVPSPVSGTIVELLAEEGDTVEVGTVIAKIAGEGAAVIASEAKTETKSTAQIAPQTSTVETVPQTNARYSKSFGDRFYSPLVRNIAKDNDVTPSELERIPGTGLNNRVTKNDILEYIEVRKSTPSQLPAQKPVTTPSAPKPQVSQTPAKVVEQPQAVVSYGQDHEIIPMDRVRSLIADHMVFSKHTSPHVTSVGEADVTGIVNFRNRAKSDFFGREGFKLTFTPFFAKAILDAVREFPMVNVSVDGKNIIKHNKINLGFATALPDGNLIVPVIKNADNLSLTGLSRSIADLSGRARDKKLNPDEIQDGTITFTNVGTFGTLFGTPIINQPQTAIIGVGAIQKRPVVKEFNGEYVIVPRDMMYVSITYDHRVIDGMLAGKTLAAITRNLEAMNEESIMF